MRWVLLVFLLVGVEVLLEPVAALTLRLCCACEYLSARAGGFVRAHSRGETGVFYTGDVVDLELASLEAAPYTPTHERSERLL